VARGAGEAEQGAIIVLFALMLVVICLFAALAIDLGNLSQNHQVAQDATDSAAEAGADFLASASFSSGSLTEPQVVTDVENEVVENSPNYPGLTVGSALWDSCRQSLPSGWPTWPQDASGNAQDCIAFNSSTKSADVVQVAIPPQLVSYWFGKVNGITGQSISAVSTAEVSPGGGPGPCAVCLLGTGGTDLDITGSGSTVLSVSGTGGASADVIDDSTSSEAASLVGSGSEVAASGQIELAGGPADAQGVGCSPCYSPAPTTGSVTDPLAGLGTPSSGSVGIDNGDVSQTCAGSCSLTLTPGIYSSVSLLVSGTENVTLEPGTYVFTGPFSTTGAGNTTISGSGVLLYFTCGSGTTPAPCASGGQSGGDLDLDASGTTALDLSPETTGPFAGLTIYYDRHDTSGITMKLSGGSDFSGSVYAAAGHLQITTSGSTATLDSMIDVSSMELTSSGGTGLDVEYDASQNIVPAGMPELCSLAAGNC
jgi:Putative Flp pilus-assembly TadE/G-like